MYIRTQHSFICDNKMLFLIHLLIFSLLPCLSTSSYDYGIIRNASINATAIVHFNFTGRTCDDCLCHAFKNYDKVNLFTCTQNVSDSICKFYNPTPTRDKIENSSSHTSIYLIKNETFKDDCCNTEFLAAMIYKKSPAPYMESEDLRSLIEGDHDTLVANTFNLVIKFNKSTFEVINKKSFSFRIYSIGYWDNKYYLGIDDNILIYDETLTTLMLTVPIRKIVTTIRFLNGTYMLVGTVKDGVFIYKKDKNGIFAEDISKSNIGAGAQIHAIGIVNETAFYIGWDADDMNLILYTIDEANPSVPIKTNTISYREKTSDVVFDEQCSRIWVVSPYKNEILVYEQNKPPSTIDLTRVGKKLFNLLIVDKSSYTLAISTSSGLYRIQPGMDCRT